MDFTEVSPFALGVLVGWYTLWFGIKTGIIKITKPKKKRKA